MLTMTVTGSTGMMPPKRTETSLFYVRPRVLDSPCDIFYKRPFSNMGGQ